MLQQPKGPHGTLVGRALILRSGGGACQGPLSRSSATVLWNDKRPFLAYDTGLSPALYERPLYRASRAAIENSEQEMQEDV